jgi:signal transduction histidine kinase
VTIDELRDTFLFEAFSNDQLRWLADHAEEVAYPAGERFVTDGEPVEALWVLLDGEMQILRSLAGRETVMGSGSAPGTWAGWLPVFGEVSVVTARTLRPSRFARIPKATVQELLSGGYPVAMHLLQGITSGVQNFAAMAGQQEKLAALGKLSAGLAHELNNPAAAASRAAEGLRAALHDRDERALAVGRLLDAEEAAFLVGLSRDCGGRATAVVGLGPLERSDREDALAAWLEERGVADAYDLAPALVEAGLAEADLEVVASRIAAPALPDALGWLGASLVADGLAAEVEQSAARVSELVRSIKEYTFLDRAPEQEVDVRDGIETTLQILAYKLRGVAVAREYAPDLPRITAYASALNQVWTNLLDNAVDAVAGAPHGEPRIAIRTARDDGGGGVLVEIADNGVGIPADVQARIFEPFFTTKGVGEGSGLGLDTSYRVVVNQHGGALTFTSKPGETRFTVRLPRGGVGRR